MLASDPGPLPPDAGGEVSVLFPKTSPALGFREGRAGLQAPRALEKYLWHLQDHPMGMHSKISF